MTDRIGRVTAVALLVVGVGAFVFFIASALTREALPGAPTLLATDISFAAAFSAFLPMGVFIALRRPRHPIGWIMCGIGLSNTVSMAATEYAAQAVVVRPGSLPLGSEVAWAVGWSSAPTIPLLTLLMLLFPTGRFLSSRWRWVGRVTLANMLFLAGVQMTLDPRRGRELIAALLQDQDVPEGLLVPGWMFEASWLLLIVLVVVGFASLVVRFRRSTGLERQQLKWMAYVAAVVATLVALNVGVFELTDVESTVADMTEHVLNIGVACIPIAAAIAISRYRLYEIDVVINRTLVYGMLTAILVATYIGLVFALQGLLAPVTADSDLAVAASTLAVAALFRPLRARIQGFIDLRFYRRKFDAQRTLEDFSTHLRDEVELPALSSRLTAVVTETMQPAHVSLWLRERIGGTQ
jgi:hypothetical protein